MFESHPIQILVLGIDGDVIFVGTFLIIFGSLQLFNQQQQLQQPHPVFQAFSQRQQG
jgi:hypothetical protein